MLSQIIILAAIATGMALLLRSLPGVSRVQGYLEGTWTHGKPLTCWVCLVGWCGLLALGAAGATAAPGFPGTLVEALAVWLGSVGLGGLVLRVLVPIAPVTMTVPNIEVDNDEPPREDVPEVLER